MKARNLSILLSLWLTLLSVLFIIFSIIASIMISNTPIAIVGSVSIIIIPAVASVLLSFGIRVQSMSKFLMIWLIVVNLLMYMILITFIIPLNPHLPIWQFFMGVGLFLTFPMVLSIILYCKVKKERW